jgi:hypothetical protein
MVVSNRKRNAIVAKDGVKNFTDGQEAKTDRSRGHLHDSPWPTPNIEHDNEGLLPSTRREKRAEQVRQFIRLLGWGAIGGPRFVRAGMQAQRPR